MLAKEEIVVWGVGERRGYFGFGFYRVLLFGFRIRFVYRYFFVFFGIVCRLGVFRFFEILIE